MRALLLLTTLTLSTFLTAQEYERFIQPQARWMVNWDLVSTIWDADYFYENVFGADTLINDTLYTIVWRNHYARTGEPGGFETIIQPFEPGFQDELVGYVREDTMLQHIYYRATDNSLNDEEVLLYDFNLQVGDTFFDHLAGNGPYTVLEVETQFIYNAERRIWRLDEGTSIIEGIGSELGPFEGFTQLISGGTPSLHQYCNGPAMDCHVSVDGFVNNRRQINLMYSIPDIDNGWSSQLRQYRFSDTVHYEGHVYWRLDNWDSILYRQDGSKVYRYHPEYDSEVVLLYDFELDTINYLYESDYPDEFSVLYHIAVQNEFELDDGEIRDGVFLFSDNPQAPWQETVQWVDGIGDIRNPLFPEEYLTPYFDIVKSELVCFWDDYEQEPIYRNPFYTNCNGDIIDNTEEVVAQAYVLYPNPTRGLVRINGLMEGKQIILMDLFGRVVYTAEQQMELNLTDLPPGTYFYNILEQDGQSLQSGKLLKQ